MAYSLAVPPFPPITAPVTAERRLPRSLLFPLAVLLPEDALWLGAYEVDEPEVEVEAAEDEDEEWW